ncbi:hypothetical protein SSX86_006177 [Deinandra increscens subsp. villosa]|uniref:AAA-type ATPase N-terminal domain-containing protein n=1 Tax=Deinandra increscens subsp. villosa TaxID=3103831 RepID=A0AAP0DN02_9ASTR
MMGDTTQLGSAMAVLMFVWAAFSQLFPDKYQRDVRKYVNKVVSYVYPYVEITFHEYQVDSWFERSKAFISIERYLSTNSANRAKRLKASVVKDSESIILSMDDNEEVTDEFNGIRIWWTSSKKIPQQRALFLYRLNNEDEHRFYKLTCRREHRDVITNVYLKHVLDEGKAIAVRTRQRKLYTNNKIENGRGNKRTWSHVVFEHPSTFDTLAMDPKKKKDILNDLMTFRKSKDYYKKVGKSWKRGYLLYGPPGTGKSTLMATRSGAMDFARSSGLLGKESINDGIDVTGMQRWLSIFNHEQTVDKRVDFSGMNRLMSSQAKMVLGCFDELKSRVSHRR